MTRTSHGQASPERDRPCAGLCRSSAWCGAANARGQPRRRRATTLAGGGLPWLIQGVTVTVRASIPRAVRWMEKPGSWLWRLRALPG